MFESFTDTSRRAVAIANVRTHQLGGNIIGDVELLIGIAAVPSCNGATVLRQLGVNLKRLRLTLERQARPQDDGTAPRMLPQSLEFKLAIEAAIKLSKDAGHGWVGTEHMLLGLLGYSDTASSQVLAAFGVSFNHARRAAHTPAAAHRAGGEA